MSAQLEVISTAINETIPVLTSVLICGVNPAL